MNDIVLFEIVYYYITVGLITGFTLFIVDLLSMCQHTSVQSRIKRIVFVVLLWLPLIVFFAFGTVFSFLSWIGKMIEERDKVTIFNEEHSIGDIVHFTRDNFEEKDLPTLSEAKIVKLYYGYRACIELNIVPEYTVMVDLKHITKETDEEW